jgi:hypothetical protein
MFYRDCAIKGYQDSNCCWNALDADGDVSWLYKGVNMSPHCSADIPVLQVGPVVELFYG